MAKQKQPDEKLLEGTFPVSGLYISNPFEEQPPQTAPVGVNVRANDTTLRQRGGSRFGLGQYIPEKVYGPSEENFLIQHINIIVDPQADALLGFGGFDGSDGSSWSGRNYNGGFMGYAPIRHPKQPGRTFHFGTPRSPLSDGRYLFTSALAAVVPYGSGTGQITVIVNGVTRANQPIVQLAGAGLGHTTSVAALPGLGASNSLEVFASFTGTFIPSPNVLTIIVQWNVGIIRVVAGVATEYNGGGDVDGRATNVRPYSIHSLGGFGL